MLARLASSVSYIERGAQQKIKGGNGYTSYTLGGMAKIAKPTSRGSASPAQRAAARCPEPRQERKVYVAASASGPFALTSEEL